MLESKKAKVTLVFIVLCSLMLGYLVAFGGPIGSFESIVGLLEVVAMGYYGSQGAVDATEKWKRPKTMREP